MIFGIGVDIVSNERIKNVFKKHGNRFLEKAFTKREIEYCLKQKNYIQHIAARFAAKEAVIKALNKPKGIWLKDIEISNNENGTPEVKISKLNGKRFLLSLSHEKTYSIAFAILLSD